MSMNPSQFAKIADSLRQYRRAELKDFQRELGAEPVEALYVDPLESNAVLETTLLNNTTFLVGRKGTGKSTVFAKAQTELRKRSEIISVYIDVKSVHELLTEAEVPAQGVQDVSISQPIYRAHLLRKRFLGVIIADLIRELKTAYEARSLFDKWLGKKRGYKIAVAALEKLAAEVKAAKLSQEEIPILRTMTVKHKDAAKTKETLSTTSKLEPSFSLKPEIKASAGVDVFDETVADTEIYQEYADAVLRSFPFQAIITQIQEFLSEANLTRLFVFFDDFSELGWVDQKLFVDVILSPLNNASDETIKLKVAGYPGRIYYGKIDPGKVDTIGLDFYHLYKASDIQTSEASAVSYLQRLLTTRFTRFGEDIGDYFDPSTPLLDHLRLLFEVTLNVPRLIGYVLHYCYLDRVAKGQYISASAIRLSAQKYYETVITRYFDRMNRYAMEPFERKLDRSNQQQLLRCLVEEARNVRRGISAGKIGGNYFKELHNPPVSHFAVSQSMEKLLSALELNFLVTKYHEMRDKSGKDVSIYTFFYGLCESERFPWGYPRGRRDDRSYFVQRCFNYNDAIQQFLSNNQTIRCDACGACFGIEKRDNFEFYKWRCPECITGTCSVVSLGDEFQNEMKMLDKDTMLPQIELEILETLNEEDKPMRASEIAPLIDSTYQLVGHRTTKLHEMGLVEKTEKGGVPRSAISLKAKQRYFGEKMTLLTEEPES